MLIYMRHNILQVVIGEQPACDDPPISRVIKVMTGAIVWALKDMLLTAEEVPEGCDFRAGCTLFICWEPDRVGPPQLLTPRLCA